QVQPGPPTETRFRSGSTTSVSVTGVVPSVAAVPELLTVIAVASAGSPWVNGVRASDWTVQATWVVADPGRAAAGGASPGTGSPLTRGAPSAAPSCSTPGWAATTSPRPPSTTVAGTFHPARLTTGAAPARADAE